MECPGRRAAQHVPVCAGAGAAEYGGRWNSPGRPVIYASGSLSLAMLEQLAQTGTGRLPHNQVFIEITIPDDVSIERVGASDIPGWASADRQASRTFGDCWLTDARPCVLLVPSAIVPTEQNVAINPAHADFARIRTSASRTLKWDQRIKTYMVGRG